MSDGRSFLTLVFNCRSQFLPAAHTRLAVNHTTSQRLHSDVPWSERHGRRNGVTMTTQQGTYPVPGPESSNGGAGVYEMPIDSKEETGFYGDVPKTSAGVVYKLQSNLAAGCIKYKTSIVNVVLLLLLIGYTVYFAFAIKYSVEGATALIVITCLVVAWLCYAYIRDTFGEKIYACCLGPCVNAIIRNWHCLQW